MYDLGDDPRGRPNQTVEHYQLSAPVIVDGEDPLDEPAALERVIGIRLLKQAIQPDTEPAQAYNAFTAMDVTGFAAEWLKFSLAAQPQKFFVQASAEVSEVSDRLPHRVASNFAVVWVGWLMVNEWLGILPDIHSLVPSVTHSYNFKTGRNRMHIDDLIEQVVATVAQGNPPFFSRYDDRANTLSFHFGSTMSWYEAQCRRRGLTTLGRDALASQLMEAPFVKGTKMIESRWCYIVDLMEASRVLDVPSRLTISQIVIDLPEAEYER
jgi:hypothetical protein